MHLRLDRKAFFTGVVISSAVFLIVLRFWPKPSLTAYATGAMGHLLKADSDWLYDNLSVHERSEMGFDRREFREPVDHIQSLLKAWNIGKPQAEMQGPDSCMVGVEVNRGRVSCALNLLAYDTGDGFSWGGLPMLLARRYFLEFPVVDARLSRSAALSVALLGGLERDRARLEAMGCKGVSRPLQSVHPLGHLHRPQVQAAGKPEHSPR